jgi:hypothetical protein
MAADHVDVSLDPLQWVVEEMRAGPGTGSPAANMVSISPTVSASVVERVEPDSPSAGRAAVRHPTDGIENGREVGVAAP